jgi:hypothetical protein
LSASLCLCRVRIEILRAIATRIGVPEHTAFCVANNSRPYLSVGPPGRGQQLTFKFTEAVESFGEQLLESDLGKAYERAGLKFPGIEWAHLYILLLIMPYDNVTCLFLGKMSKYFLVLNDQRAMELHCLRTGQPMPNTGESGDAEVNNNN